jgi:hypothetical protein
LAGVPVFGEHVHGEDGVRVVGFGSNAELLEALLLDIFLGVEFAEGGESVAGEGAKFVSFRVDEEAVEAYGGSLGALSAEGSIVG